MSAGRNTLKRLPKYRKPPTKWYRSMGLGVAVNGYVKVIAGFNVMWWDLLAPIEPVFVQARILRLHDGLAGAMPMEARMGARKAR